MIEAYTIDSLREADDYLRDLLANPDHRSLDEIMARADRYIKSESIKLYFTSKGREMLKAY